MKKSTPIASRQTAQILKVQEFELGSVLATPAAVACLRDYGLDPIALIALHAQKEWGVLDQSDIAANEQALLDGGRILSAYRIMNTKVHVITEAVGDDGHRACTTLLLAEEEY
jgi:hypothetical protein